MPRRLRLVLLACVAATTAFPVTAAAAPGDPIRSGTQVETTMAAAAQDAFAAAGRGWRSYCAGKERRTDQVTSTEGGRTTTTTTTYFSGTCQPTAKIAPAPTAACTARRITTRIGGRWEIPATSVRIVARCTTVADGVTYTGRATVSSTTR
jgi:hypothetical protein